jgi:hypothetical protein
MSQIIQGDLFATAAGASEESLRRFLADAGNCRVELTLTRNRVSMATLQFKSQAHVRVRLHEQFLTAPQEVWDALARYIRTRRRKDWDLVAAFASNIDTSSEKHEEKRITLKQKGQVYDLAKIAKKINRRFFNGRVKYRIGWGRERSERRRGRKGVSIRYGSWSRTSGIIRIHPLLDDERVPQKFVEYIVFHEMLHAVVPSDRSDGRRYDHPENFRAFERAYPDFHEMRRLSKELLNLLC